MLFYLLGDKATTLPVANRLNNQIDNNRSQSSIEKDTQIGKHL